MRRALTRAATQHAAEHPQRAAPAPTAARHRARAGLEQRVDDGMIRAPTAFDSDVVHLTLHALRTGLANGQQISA